MSIRITAAEAPATPSAPVASQSASPSPTGAAPPATEAASGAASGATGASETPPAEGTPPAAPATDPSKLERAKAAAARAQADAKRAAERRAREQQAATERATLQAEVERLKARASKYDELEQLTKTDRIAAAQKLGLSPQEITKAALAEQSPDHQAAKLRSELERQFEEKYGAKIAEQQKLIDGWTQQQRAQALHRAEADFTGISSNETTYPNLADVPPLLRIELARKLVNDLSAEQRALVTNADLCQFLEKQLSDHRTARKTPNGAPSVSTPNAAAGSAQSRTTTNGSTGDSPDLPKDWDSWSDSRQKRWMAETITKRAQAKAQAAAPK